MADSSGGKRCDREDHYRCAAVTHPMRSRLLRLIPDHGEVGAEQLAGEVGGRASRIVYHLRVLTRHGALRVVPRRRPRPPLYRHPADREWVRKLLDEIDPPDGEDA
jgi:DNA-binding transcriptional ArsR family regulator